MPYNDYTCLTCLVPHDDLFVQMGERPPCPTCNKPMEWTPRSRPARTDFLAEPTEITLNGRTVRVTTVQEARRVERESEQLSREGVGQPFVFRALAQNRSNMDANVFEKSAVREVPLSELRARMSRGGPFSSRGRFPTIAAAPFPGED